ncbi:MAG: hypothetical protein DRN29_06390, partial [Thermoplasmata archaeon]
MEASSFPFPCRKIAGKYIKHNPLQNEDENMKKECVFFGLAILVVGVALAINANAINGAPTEVWVDDDFDASTPDWQYDHFDNIQDGINAVAEGGIVHVWNGTYYESVWINKTVTIVGNGSIDAKEGGGDTPTELYYPGKYGFFINANYTNISGFLITSFGESTGIYINNSNYCNISGNVLQDNDNAGIYLGNASYNTIYNNWIGAYITYPGYGIYLMNSSWNKIEKNCIKWNEFGILYEEWWGGVCHNTIINNNISENQYGITMFDTDNETIVDNEFWYNEYFGVYFEKVDDSLIADNNFTGNGWNPGKGPDAPPGGIIIYDCRNIIVYHNMINGSYVGDTTGISITGGGGIPGCNNTIIGNTIWGHYNGVALFDTDNESIENNNISWNYFGVYLEESVYNTILKNNITKNGCGIYMEDSPHTDIIENYIAENIEDTGIYIDENSNHTTIFGNKICNNDIGIYVYGGHEGAYNNTDMEIHWNKIYNNSEYGLLYYMSGTPLTPYINATYNFWGNGNGPSNTSMIDHVTGEWANGTGDAIGGGVANDNIHFDPWIGKLILYAGWNAITMPIWNNSIATAEDLGNYINSIAGYKICTVIAKWDALKQRYISHVVGFGAGFSLKPGEGYFIFMKDDINVSINGTIIEPAVAITLKPGYNFIGHTKVIPTTAKDLGSNISNCTKIASWNETLQQWMPEYSVIYNLPK